jgi:hypothetical protein
VLLPVDVLRHGAAPAKDSSRKQSTIRRGCRTEARFIPGRGARPPPRRACTRGSPSGRLGAVR